MRTRSQEQTEEKIDSRSDGLWVVVIWLFKFILRLRGIGRKENELCKGYH